MKTMEINGQKIVDAKKPLTITITRQDIKASTSKAASSCAAARALIRQTGCGQARVHLGRTYVKQGNKWIRYFTPKDLRDEIVAFDRGGAFEPGTFTLQAVPSWFHTPAAKKRPEGSRNRTGKRRTRHIVTGVRAHGANV